MHCLSADWTARLALEGCFWKKRGVRVEQRASWMKAHMRALLMLRARRSRALNHSASSTVA